MFQNGCESSTSNAGIDSKWVVKENRVFSSPLKIFSPACDNEMNVNVEKWLELAVFVCDDLLWLLSIEHDNFWSHMMYSKEAHKLVKSTIKFFPPNYLRQRHLVNSKIEPVLQKMEHLILLVYLRLSTNNESSKFSAKSLTSIINEYKFFNISLLLDICLIYGCSNPNLVEKIMNNVSALAPEVLNDFEKVVACMTELLQSVKHCFLMDDISKRNKMRPSHLEKVKSLIFLLHDSLAAIQIFLNYYPFNYTFGFSCDFIKEIVFFYSNVLPQIASVLGKENFTFNNSTLSFNCFVEEIRIDILKISEKVFICMSEEVKGKPIANEESFIDNYLNIASELVSESCFFCDLNKIGSVSVKIKSILKELPLADTIKVNHISRIIDLSDDNSKQGARFFSPIQNLQQQSHFDETDEVTLSSLVSHVKEILPHLQDLFIKENLKRYNYDTEKFISSVLDGDNWSCNSSIEEPKNVHERPTSEGTLPLSPRRNAKSNNNKLLKNHFAFENVHSVDKEKYSSWFYVEDETYDDEYDDTYDENVDSWSISEEEKEKRAFDVPRISNKICESLDEEECEDHLEKEEEVNPQSFLVNPAKLREERDRKRGGATRGASGRARGKTQSKNVERSRDFKESHKAFIGNHNRKAAAGRKRNQGIMPS